MKQKNKEPEKLYSLKEIDKIDKRIEYLNKEIKKLMRIYANIFGGKEEILSNIYGYSEEEVILKECYGFDEDLIRERYTKKYKKK